MSVNYFSNNIDCMADNFALGQMRDQMLSDALDQNEFNTKKRRNDYLGICISNRQEADFPQNKAAGKSVAVKMRLFDCDDEYLPDFCAKNYTPKQKLILESCHSTAISKNPLSNNHGEKVPQFGQRINMFFSEESPDYYGRMRDLRYSYPTSRKKGKMVRNCPPAQPVKVPKAELLGDKIQINEKIYFAHDKAVIRKKSYDVLEAVASILKKNPHIKIKIEGHTDTTGSEAYNLKLSEKRANAVKKHLININGVPSGTFTSAIGYGESRPFVEECKNPRKEDVAYCHERNRRVEFIIDKTEETSSKPADKTTSFNILKDPK